MASSEDILKYSNPAAQIELLRRLAISFKITDAKTVDNYLFEKGTVTAPVDGVNITVDWTFYKQPLTGQRVSSMVGNDEVINDMGVCDGYLFEMLADSKQDVLFRDTQEIEEYKADKLIRLDETLTAINELIALVQAEKVNIESGGESTLKEIKPIIEYAKTLKTNAE